MSAPERGKPLTWAQLERVYRRAVEHRHVVGFTLKDHILAEFSDLIRARERELQDKLEDAANLLDRCAKYLTLAGIVAQKDSINPMEELLWDAHQELTEIKFVAPTSAAQLAERPQIPEWKNGESLRVATQLARWIFYRRGELTESDVQDAIEGKLIAAFLGGHSEKGEK